MELGENDFEEEYIRNVWKILFLEVQRESFVWMSKYSKERKLFGEVHKFIPSLSWEQFKNLFLPHKTAIHRHSLHDKIGDEKTVHKL